LIGDRRRRLQDDDRAVSIAVGYVLTLGIATLLFSVLLIGGSGMIESQTRSVTHDELSVTGQQLAADLSGADRLVRANVSDGGGPETLRLRTDLPERTAAGGYTVEISHDGTEGTIELRSSSPEVVVRVHFRSVTPVQEPTVGGGTVETGYKGGELVVESV
jgi:hypothetical protein